MADVKPIPDHFATVSAYLVVSDAVRALEFYARAFGAEPGDRMPGPGGQGTLHAEMRLGDSTVMLSDENPAWGMKSPLTLGGSPVSLHIYTKDADALFEQAVAAGCEVQMPIHDAFWGDRYARVRDPFGHSWGISTHVEDVPPDEMQRRAAEFFAKAAGSDPCD